MRFFRGLARPILAVSPLLLLLLPIAATAQEPLGHDFIGASVTSRHFGPGSHDESNAGVVYSHPTDRLLGGAGLRSVAGAYQNSESRTSVFAGLAAVYPADAWVRAKLTAGVITGYRLRDTFPGYDGRFEPPVLPLLVPSIEFGRRLGVEAIGLPGAVGFVVFVRVPRTR